MWAPDGRPRVRSASTTLGKTVRPSYSVLLREPLTWAAIAALVGPAVALAGTFSWFAWESVLNASSGPIPVPPWLASWAPPSGDLLATLSLLGAYLLLGRRSWAAMAGGLLLLLRLAASASFVLYSAFWMPGQLPASVGLPFIPFLSLQASLWLGPAATLLLALGALLSEGERRLGVVLLGLGAFGQPLVFALEALPGEGFYLSGTTVLLLGWPSGGINLPEAAFFALLALLLLRRARQRTVNRLWEDIGRENQEKTYRFYEGASVGVISPR